MNPDKQKVKTREELFCYLGCFAQESAVAAFL